MEAMNEMMQAKNSAPAQIQESRELSEIKGKMFLARQFPRDEDMALQRTLRDCERLELAEVAQYEFKRGDSVVRGPSIRLVEVLARNWGNLSFGIREVDTSQNGSMVEAFAWDLQTNTYDSKLFFASNTKTTKYSSRQLSDPRDIYENMANQAARRKRACILSVLPGWYVEQALAACDKTLKSSLTENGKNMEQIRGQIVAAFQEWNISQEQIREKIGRDVIHLTENDVVRLRRLYMSIKDGFVKPEDVFGGAAQSPALPSEKESVALDALNARLNGGMFHGPEQG